MKKLLLALAFALAPTLASAACSGVFPAATVCGVAIGSPAGVPNPLPLSNFAIGPGGTTGQIQINQAPGVFGGFTASGDATINTGTGVVTLNTVATSKGGTGANNSTNSAGDVLASNGANGTFVHTALNAICSTAPSVCAGITGYYNVGHDLGLVSSRLLEPGAKLADNHLGHARTEYLQFGRVGRAGGKQSNGREDNGLHATQPVIANLRPNRIASTTTAGVASANLPAMTLQST